MFKLLFVLLICLCPVISSEPDILADKLGVDQSDPNFGIVQTLARLVQADQDATDALRCHYDLMSQGFLGHKKLSFREADGPIDYDHSDVESKPLWGLSDTLSESLEWERNLSIAWGYIKQCNQWLAERDNKFSYVIIYLRTEGYAPSLLIQNRKFSQGRTKQFLPLALVTQKGIISEELMLYGLLNNVWLFGVPLDQKGCVGDNGPITAIDFFRHDWHHLLGYSHKYGCTGITKKIRNAVLESPAPVNSINLFWYLHEFIIQDELDEFLSNRNLARIYGCPPQYESTNVAPWVFAFLENGKLRETPRTWDTALLLSRCDNEELQEIGKNYLDSYSGAFSCAIKLFQFGKLKIERFYVVVSYLIKKIYDSQVLPLSIDQIAFMGKENLEKLNMNQNFIDPKVVKTECDNIVKAIRHLIGFNIPSSAHIQSFIDSWEAPPSNTKKAFGCPPQYEKVFIEPWVFAFLDGDKLIETSETGYAAFHFSKCSNPRLQNIGQDYLEFYNGEVSSALKLMRDFELKPARLYFIVSEILKIMRGTQDLILPYENFIKLCRMKFWWIPLDNQSWSSGDLKLKADCIIKEISQDLIKDIPDYGDYQELLNLLLTHEFTANHIKYVSDLRNIFNVAKQFNSRDLTVLLNHLSSCVKIRKSISLVSQIPDLIKFFAKFDGRDLALVCNEIESDDSIKSVRDLKEPVFERIRSKCPPPYTHAKGRKKRR